MYDYIIVGQGIAGSILAHHLKAQNSKVFIFNNESIPSSSSVAGGMFNAVTGKHLAKTWLAQELYDYLHIYYKALEKELDGSFFHPIPVYRPYVNQQQKEQFEKAIDKHELQDFVITHDKPQVSENYLKNELGGISTLRSGWVNVPELIQLLRTKFLKERTYMNVDFDFNKLKVDPEKVIYENIEARNIIFCEGYYVKNNPYFNWLPFNPVKGETLKVEMKDFPTTHIVNQNSWIIPLGKNKYRLGATYSWHELDFLPTEKAKNDLREKVEKYNLVSFNILNQEAGVRPATNDRRPIVGPHPEYPNIHIFNGMGTKGVSLAPYLAQNFANFLLFKKEIQFETTITRHYPLY